ncbi:hypothetical protein [Streptosporangium sp. NPDC003464]
MTSLWDPPTRTPAAAHGGGPEAELEALCRSVPVPEAAWRWVENAQYKLTEKGQHRSAGPIDLLLCATAVHHGLTVPHIDDDSVTVSMVMTEVLQRDVRMH